LTDFPLSVERDRRWRTSVLLGGPTSERHVSRQTGFFVGLCLAAAGHDVDYVFMDTRNRFWRIGLFFALQHTVEEIEDTLTRDAWQQDVSNAAGVLAGELGTSAVKAGYLEVGAPAGLPDLFVEPDQQFAFIGLHGGPGEDGTVQGALDTLRVPYNGTRPLAS